MFANQFVNHTLSIYGLQVAFVSSSLANTCCSYSCGGLANVQAVVHANDSRWFKNLAIRCDWSTVFAMYIVSLQKRPAEFSNSDDCCLCGYFQGRYHWRCTVSLALGFGFRKWGRLVSNKCEHNTWPLEERDPETQSDVGNATGNLRQVMAKL